MKFADRATNFLIAAPTLEALDRTFKTSCDICCYRNILHCDCDKCPVNEAYHLCVVYFNDARKEATTNETSH